MIINKSSIEVHEEDCRLMQEQLSVQEFSTLSAPEQTAESDAQPDFGSRFEVLSLVGHGGMGSVFKVMDLHLNAVFAIKTMNKNLLRDQVAQKRFEKEVEAASKLSHPSLVTVYGHGITAGGTPYMVMDFVEGQSLDEIIKDVGALEPDRACNILIQIAEGLQFAHAQGIVHRDIKPTNVLICKSGDSETAKLVDFGIAMILPTETRETRDLTQTGEVFGSPHYMSPEQCLGFMIDARSDIYSFGCMMYETLTGRPPFSGSTPVQLIIDHINADPKSFPRSLTVSKLLTMMQRITMKCLQKEQSLRCQSAEDLLKDLQSAQCGKTIQKISRTFKIKFALTKEKLAATVGIVLLVSLYSSSIDFAYPGLPNSFASELSFAGPLLLSICCALVALKQALTRVKGLKNSKATARWWLSTIMLIVGASAAILAIPRLFCGLWEGAPDICYAVSIVSNTLGQLATATLVIALLAYLLFGKQNLVPLKFVGTRLAAMMMFCVFIATVAMPDITIDKINDLADECAFHFPTTSIALSKLSCTLNPKPTASLHRRLSHISNLQEQLGLHQDRIATLSTIIGNGFADNNFYGRSPYIERASLYLRAGQLDKAEQDIRTFAAELAKRESNHETSTVDPVLREPLTAAYLGLIRSRQDRFDEAFKYFDLALQMDPSYQSAAFQFRIGTYARLRQFDKAIVDINRSLKARSSGSYQSYIKRAIVYENMGNTKLARDDYRTACKIIDEVEKKQAFGYRFPVNNNHFFLCKAYANLRLGNTKEYKEAIDTVIERAHGNTQTKSDLAYELQLGQSNLNWKW